RPLSTPFPYTTLFRSPGNDRNCHHFSVDQPGQVEGHTLSQRQFPYDRRGRRNERAGGGLQVQCGLGVFDASLRIGCVYNRQVVRSEEHTSEVQSRENL